MRKILFAALMLMFVMSCASEVKYSPYEINSFSPEIQDHIKKSEVTLAMTTAAVRLSWGSPAVVNVLEPDPGTGHKEEWIYTRLRFMVTRLIFTDGKVTGIISGMAKRKNLLPEKSAGSGTQETQPESK